MGGLIYFSLPTFPFSFPEIQMTRIPLILSLLALLPASAIAQNTWYVPDDFSTIQAGIDGSVNGDTVIVRDGTYVENLNFNGKAITLKSENGPASTIIDGNQSAAVVTFISHEDSGSVLEGFTVTNGRAVDGGGIRCGGSGASPTIRFCLVQGNTVDNFGGGMYCTNSSPTLENCTFTENTADNDGGGMFCTNSSPALVNCTFVGNEALSQGGGLFCYLSSPTLANCTFTNNTAGGGGGMLCNTSSPILDNCAFRNNTSSGAGGGGIACWYTSNPLLG